VPKVIVSVWQIQFVTETTTVYTDNPPYPYSLTCGPYCTKNVPDSTAFADSLLISGDSAALSDYKEPEDPVTDNTRFIWLWRKTNYCPYFSLTASGAWLKRPIGAEMTGTWVRKDNCHFLGSKGHFTAILVRQGS